MKRGTVFAATAEARNRLASGITPKPKQTGCNCPAMEKAEKKARQVMAEIKAGENQTEEAV